MPFYVNKCLFTCLFCNFIMPLCLNILALVITLLAYRECSAYQQNVLQLFPMMAPQDLYHKKDKDSGCMVIPPTSCPRSYKTLTNWKYITGHHYSPNTRTPCQLLSCWYWETTITPKLIESIKQSKGKNFWKGFGTPISNRMRIMDQKDNPCAG